MGLTVQDRSELEQALQLIANVLARNPAESAPEITPDLTGNALRRPIAWGSHVSQVFRDRVWWICDELSLDPDHLMSCMAFETGRTFSASVRNGAGSGATGLIQFMPTTATGLGTTTDKLARMTAEDQLNFVYKYFRPYSGRLKTLADVYMTILYPKAVGKPESYVLFSEGKAYSQNKGLDANKDNRVTKLEAAAKVTALYAEGRKPENLG
jgi:hypothetical protein